MVRPDAQQNPVSQATRINFLVKLMDQKALLKTQLDQLKLQHRQLDDEIAERAATGSDPLSLTRLKKQKLALKDKIGRIEDLLYPDIIA